MIGLVLLVEVDPVRSEPPQAGLDGSHDARCASLIANLSRSR
jgi:hypothetical protein